MRYITDECHCDRNNPDCDVFDSSTTKRYGDRCYFHGIYNCYSSGNVHYVLDGRYWSCIPLTEEDLENRTVISIHALETCEHDPVIVTRDGEEQDVSEYPAPQDPWPLQPTIFGA